MGFSDDCVELFGTKNLYVILQVEKTAKAAQVKKAYYKQSILWHPDRFATSDDDAEKTLATRKFQVIGKAYEILGDAEKRQVYDTTGITDDDDAGAFNDVDWSKVFRKMFKKVTKKDIDDYLQKFRGSRQEMEDIRDAYMKYKGDMNKIIETVIGASVEEEDRIREVVRHYVDVGEVPAFARFFNEPPSRRIKRLARAEREAKQADRALKQMQEDEAAGEDLVSAIQKRGQKHAEMIAALEAKFAPSAVKKPKKSGG